MATVLVTTPVAHQVRLPAKQVVFNKSAHLIQSPAVLHTPRAAQLRVLPYELKAVSPCQSLTAVYARKPLREA